MIEEELPEFDGQLLRDDSLRRSLTPRASKIIEPIKQQPTIENEKESLLNWLPSSSPQIVEQKSNQFVKTSEPPTVVLNKSYQTEVPKGKIYNLVINHFEEMLDWIRPFIGNAKNIYIYHKGNTSKKLDDYYSFSVSAEIKEKIIWQVVPNIGRDGETILRHARWVKTQMQNDAANIGKEYTLFLQADVKNHHQLIFKDIERYLESDYVNVSFQYSDQSGSIVHNKENKQLLMDKEMFPCPIPLADYYFLLTNRNWPFMGGKMPISYSNFFSVRNSRLAAHSDAFYERAYMTLVEDQSDNPEHGHYFERMVAVLFGDFPVFLPILF